MDGGRTGWGSQLFGRRGRWFSSEKADVSLFWTYATSQTLVLSKISMRKKKN